MLHRLFFISLYFLCTPLFAQYHRYSFGYSETSSADFELSNSRYTLNMNYYYGYDMGMVCFISYGKYTQSENVFRLTDSLGGFEMILKVINDTLYVEKGLTLVQGKKMTLAWATEQGERVDFVNNSAYNPQQVLSSFLLQNTTENKLLCGVYKKQGVSYEINKDSTYNAKISNIVLSEGRWKRNHHFLILTDTNLNHDFYMLIGKNNTIIEYQSPNFQSSLELPLVKRKK